MIPVVGVDHAPTTAFASEVHTPSQDALISQPVSGSIAVPKQLGTTSDRRLETPSTVSDHAVLLIVV